VSLVGEHLEFESAHRLAAVSAGGVVRDTGRCRQAGVPEGIEFQTKAGDCFTTDPEGVGAEGCRRSGAGRRRLWKRHAISHGLTQLGLTYVVGVESSTTVWAPGQQPLPPPPRKPGRGQQPSDCNATLRTSLFSVKQLALDLPSSAWKNIAWRPGSRETLRSRFAAVRVRPAHRDEKRTEPHPEEWLLIEWPKKESEPTKYWLSSLPVKTSLKSLVKIAKHRWIIERDYEELKQELGLAIMKDGVGADFIITPPCASQLWVLIGERNRFSPSVRAGHVGLSAPTAADFRPRGSPRPPRTA